MVLATKRFLGNRRLRRLLEGLLPVWALVCFITSANNRETTNKKTLKPTHGTEQLQENSTPMPLIHSITCGDVP